MNTHQTEEGCPSEFVSTPSPGHSTSEFGATPWSIDRYHDLTGSFMVSNAPHMDIDQSTSSYPMPNGPPTVPVTAGFMNHSGIYATPLRSFTLSALASASSISDVSPSFTSHDAPVAHQLATYPPIAAVTNADSPTACTTSSTETLDSQNNTLVPQALLHDIRRVNHDDRTNVERYKLSSLHANLPFKCGFFVRENSRCNKAFTTEKEINKHILGHLKNVKHICLCKRAFTKFSSMRKNQEKHNGSS